MITSKNMSIITAIIMIISITFTSFFIVIAYNIEEQGIDGFKTEQEYESKLFGTSDIISINIDVDKTQWSNMLKNAQKEEYISCDLTINGTTFNSVGIRPKGNSSLSMVQKESDKNRYSFKFDFDRYIEGQTCFGLDKLVVNNIISDTTYMKEYLSYDLMKFMGVPTPLQNYANITVNGEKWGVYLAVEVLEESFAYRNFGNNNGFLYSVKSMGAGGAGGDVGAKEGKKSSGGGDFIYSGDNIENYNAIFDNAVLKSSDDDKARVVEAMKKLSEGKELETYFDIDEILRYFAVHTTVVNLDSYSSNMKQNYYVYEENGKISILPWDYNLAFGGFQSNNATTAVNFPIDTPVSGTKLSDRPLIAKLLEIPEYKNKYHEYLSKIIKEYFNSGVYEKTISNVDKMIKNYVKDDATAFYTYDQYLEGINNLLEFGYLRSKSIEGQLQGSIPSTTENQSNSKDLLIDGSTVDMTKMGTQGGNKDKNNQKSDIAGEGIPDGMEPPNMKDVLQEGTVHENTTDKNNLEKPKAPNKSNMEDDKMQSSIKNPNGSRMDMPPGRQETNNKFNKQSLILIGISTLSLLIGLIFVARFKR